MNHLWHNRIPQTGKVGQVCGQCKKKDTTGGTHNGCSNCGKVRHIPGGRRKP